MLKYFGFFIDNKYVEYLALFLFLVGLALIIAGFFLSPKPISKKTENSTVPVIGLRVQEENPRLYTTRAYLYLDQSGESSFYSSQDSMESGRLSQIRRFGGGKLSFDGFSFYFENENSRQNFPLSAMEQILFYPNCVILLPKDKAPIPIIFLDETESLRRILETFRQEHVT